MTSSLLKPNKPLLDYLERFREVITLGATESIETVRLADVPQARDIDMIKIDVQGAELSVFKSAGSGLDRVLMIWTEVEFLPLYENQPLFADLDQFLRASGFLLHSFVDPASRRFRNFARACPRSRPRRGQTLWSDAIYVRDFRRLDTLSGLELKKLAVLLDVVAGADDLCFEVFRVLDDKEGTTWASWYADTVRRM